MMSSISGKIRLNQPFVITNGVKTGLFVVFAQDYEVTFEINAIKSDSTLGKLFLSMELDDRVFLLETARETYEGFWLVNVYDSISTPSSRDRNIVYGNLDSPVGRIDGYVPKWLIHLEHSSNSFLLSTMCPELNSNHEYFRFITNWPQLEYIRREKLRELRENLSMDLTALKAEAKFFPIFGVPLPERVPKRMELIQLCEKIVGVAKENDLEQLSANLSNLKIKIEEFESRFGRDRYSEFALARHDLLNELQIVGLKDSLN